MAAPRNRIPSKQWMKRYALYAAKKRAVEKLLAKDVKGKIAVTKALVVEFSDILKDEAVYLVYLRSMPGYDELGRIPRAARSIGQSEIYRGRVGRGAGLGRPRE